MTTTKAAPGKVPTEWQLVGKRVEVLLKDLRRHFDQIGSDATAQRAAIEDALRGLAKDVEDLFAATGDTLRDPKLRKDIAAIAAAMRSALQGAVDHAGAVQHTAAKPARRAVANGRATVKRVAPKRPAKRTS